MNRRSLPLPAVQAVALFLASAYFSVAAAQNCTLCQDGSMPPNPDLIVPNMATQTCGEWAQTALITPPSANNFQCGDYHFKGALCGCNNSPAEDFCEMCDMDLPDPDRVTNPEFLLQGGLWQCKVEQLFGRYITTEGSELCNNKKSSTGVLCGCQSNPPRELGCTLCPDPDTFVNIAVVDPPPNAKLDAYVSKEMQRTTCFNMEFYWALSMATGLDTLGDPFDEATCKSNLEYMTETYGDYSEHCCVQKSSYYAASNDMDPSMEMPPTTQNQVPSAAFVYHWTHAIVISSIAWAMVVFAVY